MKYTRKNNTIKEKLAHDQPTLGGWLLTGSVAVAEIMAQSGFDWVCIDAEHSPVTKETAHNIILAIERWDKETVVRISNNDPIECKKFLDAGARGILVPMITSGQDAQRAIQYIKYSPEGLRSFALPRATGYGAYAGEYFETANENIFVGLMIEHIDAIKELNTIFDTKGADVFFVGPYDLSGSMGIPGDFDHPEFQDALKEFYQKAREKNVRIGFHEVHPTPEKIKAHIDKGYRFIGCGLDTLFISGQSKKYAEMMKTDKK